MIKRALVLVLFAVAVPRFHAAAPIRYTFSFPEPQHRWMQVEAVFSSIPPGPLQLRMSRSSPGRYSLHDFAKNVYDVRATGAGGELPLSRPDPYGWNVDRHDGAVSVKYKVYGDRLDGTYLAVDETHAHINMPAAVMWARGLDDRPATITFQPPEGTRWAIATQLHAGSTPFEFTAPNLQYLMDSPAELGPIVVREFTVPPRTFRFSLHHTGTDAEVEAFVTDVEKIVQQEGAVYGEFPQYEPGSYTFLADYLPYASGDGMEHRNSTVMTASTSIAAGRAQLLETVAHEFFHCWNVERIRPRGLEPFDFDRANLSDSLWLAEGFTQYYGPLILRRTGLVDLRWTVATFGRLVDAVTNDAGRRTRSAAEMSMMAPFIDGGRTVDRTNWPNTVISYYTFGGAIALALDLSLRDRSGGAVTLDDYMRAMWRTYGKPGGGREGYVDHPYSLADAEATLAAVAGDAAFAREFFSRYVVGHDVADYARLLLRAGFVVRPIDAALAWLGDLRLVSRNGVRVAALVSPAWPVYATGIEQDDELLEIDGKRVSSESDLAAMLRRHKPGDRIAIAFTDRAARTRQAEVTLGHDPALEVVPIESAGGALSEPQRAFRERWLGRRPDPQPRP